MKSIFGVLVLCLGPALPAQFVPDAFQPPRTYAGRGYKLVPLGPDVAELDFKAYMGSIDHIRSTMGGKWPNPSLTMADQAKDMAGEKDQWDGRKSFPYAILSADGTKELGCFYIRPSGKAGYDAAITLWVTKDQFDAGFEKQLIPEMKAWLASAWPFKKPAWPGREIPMSQWRALPDAPRN
jgi:hypothetical protein